MGCFPSGRPEIGLFSQVSAFLAESFSWNGSEVQGSGLRGSGVQGTEVQGLEEWILFLFINPV